MSRDVEYIQNFTAFAILDSTGEFSVQGGFPTNPDEVVIRQITYTYGFGTGCGMVLIHSNLSNQIIASAIGSDQFSSNPGTRIQTRNPIPSMLTFRVEFPTIPPLPAVNDVDKHEIMIHMDFIKWKPIQK